MFLRVISTTISVFILIAASLFPYIGLKRRDSRSSRLLCSSYNLLPIFTCFACGVFMSTCFLGLMPHLQESERQIKVELNSSSPEDFKKFCLFLDSNLLILIGFLLIVLIEQSAVFCLPKSTSSTNSTIRSPTKRSENIPVETSLISQSDNQPLVRFNSSGTDSDSDGDLGRIEFRTTNSNNPHETAGHSHNHHQFVPNGSFIQSFILLFALSVHSIFEGIALGGQTSDGNFIKFLISVMLHEVLCSFAYGVKLSKSNVSLRAAFSSILFLSMTIPIGISIISLLNSKQFTTQIVKFCLESFAAGTFIYVACVEMLAEELSHSSRGFYKGLSLSFGVFTFFIFNYLVHV